MTNPKPLGARRRCTVTVHIGLIVDPPALDFGSQAFVRVGGQLAALSVWRDEEPGVTLQLALWEALDFTRCLGWRVRRVKYLPPLKGDQA